MINPHHIQSANTDVLSPSMAMTDITSIVCDMLQLNMDYVAKNGMTEPGKKSREQLIKLLNITETFNQIASANSALKTYNEHLFLENQLLKHELKQVEDENNLANSI